jgi:aminoglycoside phosphotransferase (APT) family kinase protein
MHADEVAVDEPLVRRLLAAQLPQWAGMPIEPVHPAGTDNAIYRLGDDLAVRLPRIGWAAEHPGKEYEWLPRLAPLLPLPTPVPLALGAPDEGYGWVVVQAVMILCCYTPEPNAVLILEARRWLEEVLSR